MSRHNLRRMICVVALAYMCSSCGRAGGESTRLDKPVWHVGDSWRIRAPMNAMRDFMSPSDDRKAFFEHSEYYTAQCKVVGVETLNGEKCYVLAVTAVGVYPRSQFTKVSNELRGYFRVRDLALRMVKTLTWENGSRSPQSDTTDAAGIREHVHGSSQTLTFFPIELPSFPVCFGKRQSYYHLRKHQLNDYGKEDEPSNRLYYTESTVASAEVVQAHVGKRVSQLVKIRFEDLSEKATGNRENVYMEQVWEPGKPWWTSMRDARGFEFTLLEGSAATAKKGSK